MSPPRAGSGGSASTDAGATCSTPSWRTGPSPRSAPGGFADPATFSRAFQRQFGLPPGEYRRHFGPGRH